MAKPKYRRPNYGRVKRVKANWRKPRGIDNKQRKKLKAYGAVVKVGHRKKKSERDLRNGKIELLVHNVPELEKVIKEKNNFVVRIAAGVGKKKRIEILKIAKNKKIEVVNKGHLKKGGKQDVA